MEEKIKWKYEWNSKRNLLTNCCLRFFQVLFIGFGLLEFIRASLSNNFYIIVVSLAIIVVTSLYFMHYETWKDSTLINDKLDKILQDKALFKEKVNGLRKR